MVRAGPVGQTTGEPEQSGCRLPREDPLKVAVQPWIVARRDDGEREAADLHGHKATAKRSPRSPNASGKATAMIRVATMRPISIKRTGRRSGSNQLVNQAVSTQAHHNASSSSAGLKRAASIEVREQEMGELGDRKDEDEVEEELHRGDLMVALTLAAQQPLSGITARSWFHHRSRLHVPGSPRFQTAHPIILRPRNRRDSEVRL